MNDKELQELENRGWSLMQQLLDSETPAQSKRIGRQVAQTLIVSGLAVLTIVALIILTSQPSAYPNGRSRNNQNPVNQLQPPTGSRADFVTADPMDLTNAATEQRLQYDNAGNRTSAYQFVARPNPTRTLPKQTGMPEPLVESPLVSPGLQPGRMHTQTDSYKSTQAVLTTQAVETNAHQLATAQDQLPPSENEAGQKPHEEGSISLQSADISYLNLTSETGLQVEGDTLAQHVLDAQDKTSNTGKFKLPVIRMSLFETGAQINFYTHFISREWTHKGGYQLGLQYKRALKNQSRWSLGVGLEYMRFMTGLPAHMLGSDYVRFEDLSHYKEPKIVMGDNFESSNFNSVQMWKLSEDHYIYDSYGQLLSSPHQKPVLITRQFVALPLVAVYQIKRTGFEGGIAAMMPLMSSTYTGIKSNLIAASNSQEISPRQRALSEFNVSGRLIVTHKIHSKWQARVGIQQGFRRLSVNRFPIYAPQRSLSLGLLYSIE